MQKVILAIEGMTCSACSNGLEKYLNKQNGVINASVNLVMANATIDYDEKILDKEKLEKYVKEAGFSSNGLFKEIKLEKKNKTDKKTFVLFSILAIILMYVSMGHMINLPIPSFIHPHHNPIAYAVLLCVFAILFLIYGRDILKNGYKNLIHMIPNMETLVSIGVMSSFLYSLYRMYNILNGETQFVNELYFESSAIVIYFMKLGRYLEGITRNKTKEAIQKLVEITPNQAVIEKDGKEKIVTLDEIKKGNIVICKPGEKIAVDGEIIEGKAHLEESFLTGESKPVNKTIGDKVIAGSINYDGFLKYKAKRIGKESTISEIVRLVIEATNTKAPITRLADTIAGYFVPFVLVLALITIIVYLCLGYTFTEALIPFVTLLVVACPCSLGLATPLAIVVSEGVCATNGILIKKSEILQTASKIDTIVFDKTGTLTYGTLKIACIYNSKHVKEAELMQLVASIENNSSHPISKAFTAYVEENKIDLIPVQNFESISGYGICGEIEGKKILVGNKKLIEREDIKLSSKEEEAGNKIATEGNSIVYVARDKEFLGIIGVNDSIRENAKEVIEELGKQNIEAVLLTGDNLETAQKIGNEIGITKIIADVVPAEKANHIKELKKNNHCVMMCGDGINDSPALANSDIGVSIKSGTDIAKDSADVILTQNNLKSILTLIQISRRTVRNTKQNLFWAFFYNILMIPIAIGLIHPFGITLSPMVASLAMVISSITVSLNALRLRKIPSQERKRIEI